MKNFISQFESIVDSIADEKNVLVLVLVSLYLIFILIPGSYLIRGNLHDQFIPILSAYAFDNDPSKIVSPLGYAYHLLNKLSLNLSNVFPLTNSLDQVVPVSNVIFGLFLIFWFILFHWFTKEKAKYIFLLVPLSISFSFRKMSGFEYWEVNWYGTYNNHNIALLFLNIYFSLHLFKKEFREKKANIYLLAVMQGVFLLLTLNYKINFFLSNFLITIFVFLQTEKFKKRYCLLSVVIIFSGLLLLVLSEKEFYFSHLSALQLAATAKSSLKSRFVFTDILYPLIISILILLGNRKGAVSLKNIASLYHIIREKEAKQLTLYLLLMGALFFAIQGDWAKPVIYYALTGAYIFYFSQFEEYKRMSKYLLFLFSLLNIYSLGYLVENKLTNYSRVETEEIETSKGNIKWKYLKEASLFTIDEYLYKGQMRDTAFNVSYSYYPNRLFGLPYSQYDYVKAMNEAVENVTSKFPDSYPVTTDFINPFPVLLEKKIKFKFLHWVHLGTTLTYSDLKFFNDTIFVSDLILLRNISVDGGSQTEINCSVLSDDRINKYEIVLETLYWTYLKEKKGESVTDYRISKAKEECRKILDDKI